MIEVPRGALTADEIAREADFFSFGTNDLTQMTFGYSRDDAEGGFLLKYVEDGILPVNPFQTLDDAVAGLMKTAVDKGRATKPGPRARDLRRARRRPGVDREVRGDRARLRVVLAVPRPGRPARGGPGRARRRRARQVAPTAQRRPAGPPTTGAGERPAPPAPPRRRAAPARPRLPLAVVRPGRQRDRQPDHPDRAAVPGLRPDRVDARDRGADAVPARPDPRVRARRRLAGRRRRPAAAAARDPGRAGGLQRSPWSLLALERHRHRSRPLFAVAFVAAGLGAVDQPARSSADPAARPAGAAAGGHRPRTSSTSRLASVVGPAIGGILIATVGLAGAYAVDVVVVRRVARRAAGDRAAAAARRGRAARPRRRSARASGSRATGG